MRTHRLRDAPAKCFRRDHVTAIGDMGAASAVVCSQIVGSDDGPAILGHKYGVARRVPVSEGVLARNVPRDRVGFSGAERRFEDAPDSVVVSRFRLPDPHHRWSRLGGTVRGGNPQPEIPCYESE
jgi:hypothetical protein